MEAWKNYTDKYDVSSSGRVRNSKTKRILLPFEWRGYLKIGLYLDNKRRVKKFVHRLVAETFYGMPDMPTMVVNHKDGNKHNNSIDNLEWVTPEQNDNHARNITKNGRRISYKKIKKIYFENQSLGGRELIDMILANCT